MKKLIYCLLIFILIVQCAGNKTVDKQNESNSDQIVEMIEAEKMYDQYKWIIK